MSDIFENFIAALLKAEDARFLVEHPEIGAYASTNTIDKTLYAVVDQHLCKYGKLPSTTVAEEGWGAKLPAVSEPPKFYLDKLRPVYVRKALSAAVAEANLLINTDPEKSLDTLLSVAHDLKMQQMGVSLVDFRHAWERLQKHLSSKWSGAALSIGWPSYDRVSGGIMPGDLVSVVGDTGAGKTILMLSRALYLWHTLKMPVLFFSMEIMVDALMERIAAMQAEVPFDYLKHGLFPNVGNFDFKTKLKQAMEGVKGLEAPFWLVDGNLAVGQDDVIRLCSQLQPEGCFVDGAYLMAGEKGQKKHEAVSDNTTFLKRVVATQMRIPVFASWQFSNESLKATKTKGGKVKYKRGLEAIAHSQEIKQLSSVVLGLFEDDDAASLTDRRWIEIMKGRSGEVGRFPVNWDFVNCDFQECADEEEMEPIV